jgi:hypothetical protein
LVGGVSPHLAGQPTHGQAKAVGNEWVQVRDCGRIVHLANYIAGAMNVETFG